MAKFLIIPALFFSLSGSFAQTFSYSASKNFGTSDNDVFSDAVRLPTGETIICGVISAASNDHPGAIYGGQDYWVVKTDANDNILWEKAFGGSGDDYASNIIVNSANEIFIIGTSNSPIDGNKTAPAFGYNDIWMIKMDADGNLIHQYSYGTSLGDQIYSGSAALDAQDEIILSCYTASGISGSKTSPAFGLQDIWLFKIDSNGNKLADITLGGTDAEDVATLTCDENNFVYVTIQSESDSGGNKSALYYGGTDLWIVKLDHDLNILMQNSFGGQEDELVEGCYLFNGSFYVAMGSDSPVSGTKTCTHYGNYDGLIVKLDTANLALTGQKSYGGVSSTGFFYGISNVDGQLVASGIANGGSNAFKDQSSFGGYDLWLLGLDEDLNMQWNQTVGGNLDEGFDFSKVIQSTPGKLELYSEFKSDSFTGNLGCSTYGNGDILHYTLSTNLGIVESDKVTFAAYPNPATNKLTVRSQNEMQQFELLTADGRLLNIYTFSSGDNTIDLNSIAPGSYLLKSGENSLRFIKL